MSGFRKAVREKTSLLIGIAGPSGSGKTYSGLRLATGLADGGPIFMIDTEGRRGLHYADAFSYQYAELEPPFQPHRYMEIMMAAKTAGAKVVIVDSMSHAHEGPGGLLEMHEAELDRMAGSDFRKREAVKFSGWIKPKQEHNKFVNSALQLGIHVIFLFRAKEKLALLKNAQGKMEPVPQGWQPICSDRFEYEMISLLMLPPNSKGVPDLAAGATKMQEQHRHLFPAGKQIDEEMGKRLAEWAAGGKKAAPKPAPEVTHGYEVRGVYGVISTYARPSEWIAAAEAAMVDITDPEAALMFWDANSDEFDKICVFIEKMKDSPAKTAAKDKANAVGKIAHEKMAVAE